MGCGVSFLNGKDRSDAKTADNTALNVFTAEQKHHVLRTWRYLADDLTGNGSKVFLNIFILEPRVKKIFPCANIEGDALLRDPNFKGHASRFMQAVGAVVDNIDDPEKELATLLRQLGQQHHIYGGFKVQYFSIFSQGMDMVWREELGKKYSEDTRNAWLSVFNFLCNKMQEGYESELNGESDSE